METCSGAVYEGCEYGWRHAVVQYMRDESIDGDMQYMRDMSIDGDMQYMRDMSMDGTLRSW